MIKAPLLALLLLSGCSVELADSADEEARQSLKNYGLSRCLLDSQPEEASALREDLATASQAYHFMGNGAHRIVQNENSLETLHDPYQATRDFVLNRYAVTGSAMKSASGSSAFYACLAIYNSAEFDEFVRTQNAYLP
ncbi:MAG: hypothetical protein CVV16_02335 [Gammaproteobacteria bacterium HGW-Gammaproteobacteria-6]|nr:MAG: hypothetical protein CVV16_02335 [Gammaproteobacteria bacterium HGW-Gammaproteobacteria-6]